MSAQKEFEVFLALQRKGIPLKLPRGEPEKPKGWHDPKREMSLEEMEAKALTIRETFWAKLLKDEADD